MSKRENKPLRMLGRGSLEIAVIVLGVLIALAVDEWRNGVDDRQLEREYVARLIQDLKRTEDALEYGETSAANRSEYGKWFLRQVTGQAPPAPLDQLALVAVKSGIQPTSEVPYLGSRSTYDELLSTGRSVLLQSEEIRAALAIYYKEWDRVASRIRAYPTGYASWVRGSLSPEAQNELRFVDCPVLPEEIDRCPFVISEFDRQQFGRRVNNERDEVEQHLNHLGYFWVRLEGLLRDYRTRTLDLIDQLEAFQAT